MLRLGFALGLTLSAVALPAAAMDAVVAADPAPTAPPRAVVADAAPRPSGAPPERENVYRFYGWESFLAGGIPATLIVTAIAVDDTDARLGLGIWGGLGYAIAPGIIQSTRDKWKKLIGSYAITLGMPLTGVVVGASVAHKCAGRCDEATRVGAIIGFAAAPLVDGLAFGWERRSVVRDRSDARAELAPSIGVVPVVSSEQVGVRVGGTF